MEERTKLQSDQPKDKHKKYPVFFGIIFAICLALVSVFVGFYLQSAHNFFVSTGKDHDTGSVNSEIYRLFNEIDVNKDGVLSLQEFQLAFFKIKSGASVNLTEVEAENFHGDVKEELLMQQFSDDEEIINVKANFQPMNLKTMKKFQDQILDPESLHHLHGLKTWLTPNIEYANFSVSNFSSFLPTSMWTQTPGKTWELIPKSLGGFHYSVEENQHLGGNKYLPPVPTLPFERVMFYILSMFHKRPFLNMRFPPRGAVACLRAVNDGYYSIMFRLHPEFQLNEPPYFSFWFTPASIMGELLIKKDGSHIEFFKMYLPTRKQLNIDMEWMTGAPKADGSHSQEVDIGFVEEMSITSTQPSTEKSKLRNKTAVDVINEMAWTDEISSKKAFDILEKEFYPFKEVPYVSFNETFALAENENKLVHHILLWGSLDDQSC